MIESVRRGERMESSNGAGKEVEDRQEGMVLPSPKSLQGGGQ